MDKIKTIVLTCDRYHHVTNHMITMYDKTWSDNPFVFRVPWNEVYPDFMKDKWGDKIDLIKTPVEFKKTIDGLTADLDGDEWIYWACDDVYPIEIEPERCGIISDWVMNEADDSVLSVSFINWENDLENNPVDEVEYEGLRLIRKKSVTNQWQHHFWRVKVLKTMFDCLDEPKDLAKEMDYMQKEEKSQKFWDLIGEGKWYMLDHNAAIFGESTARGFNMLLNCAGSFYENNLEIPDQFILVDVVRIKPNTAQWRGNIAETKNSLILIDLKQKIEERKLIGDGI
ncbi:hypothetical protein CMI47_13855 [Candidatus Pacearchaeota archaeon]|nr:hypothetical protein [Candidatus Pacearchaeota archaeon]